MAESPQIADGGDAPPAAAAPPGKTAPEQAAAPVVVHGGGPVILKDRYLIDLNAPLPKLDTPTASAFAVSDRRDAGSKQFALACTPGLPPRSNVLSFLKSESPGGVLPLMDYDIINWPPLQQSTLVVIYRQPLGGRLSDVLNSDEKRISEHDLAKLIIEPLSATLGIFEVRHLTHRSIRPRNMFFMDEEHKELVLGDCVATPPGYDQPLVFETIERGMASPGGRGDGGIAEDIYALGVTLAFCIDRGNPVAGMTTEEMFKSKIEQGTYATICGKMRVPVTLIEALRGMLSDDLSERWDLDALNHWLDGQRRTPIQRKPAQKADKPFAFQKMQHSTPRTLSYAFINNPDEALKTIQSPELTTWLRRSLHSPELTDTIKGTLDTAKVFNNKPQGSNDFVLTKICIALDPAAPINYKKFSFMPEAFGTAMATEYLRQGTAQIPAEVLAHDIINTWFSLQDKYDPVAIAIEKHFEQLKRFSLNNDMGYGVERVLYEINPSLPCQSPLLKEDYVAYIEDLLPALDTAANRVDVKTKPMDRHIAAFIAARFNQDIAPHLQALSSPEEEKSLIGMLSLLAFLQWHLKEESLLGLSSWLGGLLGPAINTYFSRSTRREIENDIPKLVRKGSLPELFDLIDNIEKRKKDSDEFAEAQAEFAAAEKEIQEIEGDKEKAAEKHLRTGQKTAAMCSILIAMSMVVLLLLAESW